ncbi:MAG: hypothetical protein JXR05_12590 [Flavobacteriaceae bacterium]
MKFKKVKNIATVFMLTASVFAMAQKQSKDFKESFKVKKDVTVEINATNAEIDVTTWNKNEVSVVATIEIDGLTKKEAEKYLKNYKFEALGNSSKVKITSGGNSSFRFGDNDFVIFNKNDFVIPEIVIPDFDFEMPEIVIPDVNINMSDFDFNLGDILMNLEDLAFDFDEHFKDGKEHSFRWEKDGKEIVIKSKKDWEKFKKSKDYKDFQKEMKASKDEMKKELAKAKKEIKSIDLNKTIKESLAKAREGLSKVDRVKMKKELAKARKEIKKAFKNNFVFDTDADELIINDKKVKITKKITIKVPKGATFDLNTRHCKVKLPKTKASGKVSYGTFDANGLEGGDLKIYYSPVNINTLRSSTLSLNNVTDATLASVANSNLVSDSSDLKIMEILSNTDLESSFGDLLIKKINPSIKNFDLVLNQSNATIDIGVLNKKLKVVNADTVFSDKKNSPDNSYTLKGRFSLKIENKNVNIRGKYSRITVLK